VVLLVEDIFKPLARIDALESDRARDGVFVELPIAFEADARVSIVEVETGSAIGTAGVIISERGKGICEGEGGRVEVVDRGTEP
jgi:hypothetical protein